MTWIIPANDLGEFLMLSFLGELCQEPFRSGPSDTVLRFLGVAIAHIKQQECRMVLIVLLMSFFPDVK